MMGQLGYRNVQFEFMYDLVMILGYRMIYSKVKWGLKGDGVGFEGFTHVIDKNVWIEQQ